MRGRSASIVRSATTQRHQSRQRRSRIRRYEGFLPSSRGHGRGQYGNNLGSITISALGVAAVTYLGRTISQQLLSRDMEKFKAELQLVALEHRVRFTRLHEQQAEIVAEVYGKLENVHFAPTLSGAK